MLVSTTPFLLFPCLSFYRETDCPYLDCFPDIRFAKHFPNAIFQKSFANNQIKSEHPKLCEKDPNGWALDGAVCLDGGAHRVFEEFEADVMQVGRHVPHLDVLAV